MKKENKRRLKEAKLNIKTNRDLHLKVLRNLTKAVGHPQIYLDHQLKKRITMMMKNKNLYSHLAEAALP